MAITTIEPIYKSLERIRKQYQGDYPIQALLGKYTENGFSSGLLQITFGRSEGRKDNLTIYGEDFGRCRTHGIRTYGETEAYTMKKEKGEDYPRMVYDLIQLFSTFDRNHTIEKSCEGNETVIEYGQYTIRYREEQRASHG